MFLVSSLLATAESLFVATVLAADHVPTVETYLVVTVMAAETYLVATVMMMHRVPTDETYLLATAMASDHVPTDKTCLVATDAVSPTLVALVVFGALVAVAIYPFVQAVSFVVVAAVSRRQRAEPFWRTLALRRNQSSSGRLYQRICQINKKTRIRNCSILLYILTNCFLFDHIN